MDSKTIELLGDFHKTAETLTKKWFPDLRQPNYIRITILAIMKDLVELEKLRAKIHY